jgi:choline dehydrogenase-like flavoprotein
MFVVVGSGPAGVACANALLKAGAEVTMLDAGLDLEPERQARVAALAGTPVARWDTGSLAFLREGVVVEAGGVPLKLAYGSSYPYREPLPLPLEHAGADGKPSYARGGLSSVWGASMLPFAADDVAGWPISIDELAPHYRAVLELMPYAGRRDRLADQLPLYSERPSPLRSSSQAIALMRDLEAARSTLESHGITFGTSRLAVQSASDGRPGCVYCGQCLYGCPYGYIFNSSSVLERLRQQARFVYRPGVIVKSVAQKQSGVEILGVELARGDAFGMRADRVFLACGVFSTARIVLESFGAYGKPLRAADNCYFLLPLIRYHGESGVSREPLHTLAQAFVEVTDPAVGPRTHLQVYTYNDLFRVQLHNMLGPAHRVLGRIAERAMLGRLLLIQGYLHSDVSPGVDVTLSEDGTLKLSAAPNPRTGRALAALKRKLWSERDALRALPVTAAMRVAPPGRSYHTGGTFPMRAQPTALQTDTLGRLEGMPSVHIVDASVLPNLPATTITLSVMANAHRIGAASTD